MAVAAYAVLIIGALAMIMPFIFSLANSVKTLPDITANPMLLYPTQGFSFSGYEKILNSDFARWIFNSALVAITVTLGHIVFDSMAGYALARIHFPGRNLLFAGVVGTMMVPGIVLLIPRYLVYVQLGMVDQYSGLILPTLADAFGIFLMKQFFESIPVDIEEAAFMDGAGRFRMFFTVILPMAVPALTALAIFGFQGAWNDFTGPLIAINNRQELFTLPLGLANLKGTGTGQTLPWDLLLAGSLITTLPMAVIFFVFQRFFMESATYTGVKG
jgi:multiple sugar transport system permease protein